MPVKRGRDVSGPFYRWGKHGHKYRYTPGSAASRKTARTKAIRQGAAAHSNGSGGDFWGALSKGADLFKKYVLPAAVEFSKIKPREGAPPAVREWIAKKGALPIVRIEVVRNPLAAWNRKALNAITFGAFDRQRKSLNYDDVYHLFMCVTFADGSELRMDKNHVVHLDPVKGACVVEKGGSKMDAGAPDLSLGELFARGEKVAGGPQPYWVYSAVSPTWNCQRWVAWTLQGAGLLTPALEKFINQDAPKLVESSLTRGFIDALTGIAARGDVLLHGAAISSSQ